MGKEYATRNPVPWLMKELQEFYQAAESEGHEKCPTNAELSRLAQEGADVARGGRHEHIGQCLRCAAIFSSFLQEHRVAELPSTWEIRLPPHPLPDPDEEEAYPVSLMAHISLATGETDWCTESDEWVARGMSFRVSMLIHPLIDLLIVTVFEVPKQIKSVAVNSERGWHIALEQQDDGLWDCCTSISDLAFDYQVFQGVEGLLHCLETGRLCLELAKDRHQVSDKHTSANETEVLLRRIGAIEEDYDYVLPCGLHSDKHINVGKICYTEDDLQNVASLFDRLFDDFDFDTIVTNGWAMATIARRISLLRGDRCQSGAVRVVEYLDYGQPTTCDTLPNDCRALVLVDVAVTGRLLCNLTREVNRVGGEVVAKGVLANCVADLQTLPTDVRHLCRIELKLHPEEGCPLCRTRDRREFNPLAHCMTKRATNGRSPEEFVREYQDASELWRCVISAKAFLNHKVVSEAGQKSHYTGYIDISALLSHPEAGRFVVERIRELTSSACVEPDVLLLPNRGPTQLLGKLLREAFEWIVQSNGIVYATKRNDEWLLADDVRHRLIGASVLIVDSGATQGKTIDRLRLMASRAGAARIGAAVVVSRLVEACEVALDHRLELGFHRVFNLPIPSVRGNYEDMCPQCQRRKTIEEISQATQLDAVKRWERSFNPRWGKGKVATKNTKANASKRQVLLFDDSNESFLGGVGKGVAAGIALHSLYAAKHNGMAPMSFPEIRSPSISDEVKAKILDRLPVGVLGWSRGFLDEDLLKYLKSGESLSVWRAVADVFSRERQSEWIASFEGILRRCPELQEKPQKKFWRSMACDTYLVSQHDDGVRAEIRDLVLRLRAEFAGSLVEQGLTAMLDALDAVEREESRPDTEHHGLVER